MLSSAINNCQQRFHQGEWPDLRPKSLSGPATIELMPFRSVTLRRPLSVALPFVWFQTRLWPNSCNQKVNRITPCPFDDNPFVSL